MTCDDHVAMGFGCRSYLGGSSAEFGIGIGIGIGIRMESAKVTEQRSSEYSSRQPSSIYYIPVRVLATIST